MNNLDIPRKCVLLRGGEEFWMEAGKAETLSRAIQDNTAPKFVKFEEDMFNVADITGIFTPTMMAERSKIKRGLWRCEAAGVWHKKFEECECRFSLGNKILRVGSFENWIAVMRRNLEQETAEADKEIIRYQERLGKAYPDEAWAYGRIEHYNQEKLQNANFFKNFLGYLESNPQTVEEDLYPLSDSQIEEFKKILKEQL